MPGSKPDQKDRVIWFEISSRHSPVYVTLVLLALLSSEMMGHQVGDADGEGFRKGR